MLSSKYRFHSRGGVNYVYRHGKTIRTTKLSLVHTPNSRHCRRVAVVISKKVIKSAVGRNRVRRRVYEAIRLHLPEFTAPRDYIFVIYAKDVRTMPFSDLERLIKRLLSEANHSV